MKFSTIGTSWITEMFMEAAEKSGVAELISIYSRSKESAKQFAVKNGASNWFIDMDEMLADDSDFVYVASPNSMHYEHTLECIKNKKHVFCEKPMGFTEKQLLEINNQATENNVFVFEGYRHLFSPNYEKLKANVKRLGKVRSALLHYIQYSSRYDAFKEGQEPNVFSSEFAGGALMDLGVYPLSMAIDLFGEPEEVDYFPVKLSNGIDGSGTLILTYPDFNVTIMISKIAQGSIPSEIHGEDGTLTMDHISPIQQLTFNDRKTKKKEELAGEQFSLDMIYELEIFKQMVSENDTGRHNVWMERSRQVAKWAEKARHQTGILFPGE